MRARGFFKILIPAAAAAFTLVAVEIGSGLALKWNLKPTPPDERAITRTASKFEIPQSFDRFVKYPRSEKPQIDTGGSVTYPRADMGDLWGTPSNVTFPGVLTNAAGKVLARPWVTTDEYGRRIAPWHRERAATAKYHVFLMGCSVAWGEAVDDRETLGAAVAKNDPDFQSYTLAYPGYGATEILARIRDHGALNDVRPARGAGVYVFYDNHLQRFLGSAFNAGTWRKHGLDARETAPGVFEIEGALYKSDPFWVNFAEAWAGSSFAKYFDIDLPPIDDARIDRFFRLVKVLRQEYRNATRADNPFVVLILPINGRINDTRAGLTRAEIPFLDYTRASLDDIVRGPTQVEGNGHPSAEVYDKMGEALARDLKTLLEPGGVDRINAGTEQK